MKEERRRRLGEIVKFALVDSRGMSLNAMNLGDMVATCAVEILTEDGAAPEWICLLPKGAIVGRDGRSWNNNLPDTVLNNFKQLARDLPIDIEHATEHKGPKGEPAPAVGWVRELANRDGEIWGRCSWNTQGKEYVEGQAYRYVSPVIVYMKNGREIVGITSVGLTNQPNFKLPALNHEQQKEETTMWKTLLAALSLSENSTEAEAVARVKNLQGDLASAVNRADNPSLEKFVPRADYDAMVEKANNAETALADLKKESLEDDIELAINGALEAGKITPATADYYRGQCRLEGGLAQFEKFCESAPVIGGDTDLDKKDPDGDKKALNAEEKKVCENLGITHDEYRKAAA